MEMTRTSVYIEKNLLDQAKNKGVNISKLLSGALDRELNRETRRAYLDALEHNYDKLKQFLKKFNLEDDFLRWKHEENV